MKARQPPKRPVGAPPKPEDEKRNWIVRFRLSGPEYATLLRAAELDAGALEKELKDRGLPDAMIQTLKRPSDWSRYVVMKFAKEKTAADHRQREAKAEQERQRQQEHAISELERLGSVGLGGLGGLSATVGSLLGKK